MHGGKPPSPGPGVILGDHVRVPNNPLRVASPIAALLWPHVLWLAVLVPLFVLFTMAFIPGHNLGFALTSEALTVDVVAAAIRLQRHFRANR